MAEGHRSKKARELLTKHGYKAGGHLTPKEKSEVDHEIEKGVGEHEAHLHGGKKTRLHLKDGGSCEGMAGGGRPDRAARGGKKVRGKTEININVSPPAPPMMPPHPPMMIPPHPPMAGPPPGAGGPPGMPPGGMPPHPPMGGPPGMPPGAPPGMPPRPPGMKSGGRTHKAMGGGMPINQANPGRVALPAQNPGFLGNQPIVGQGPGQPGSPNPMRPVNSKRGGRAKAEF